MSGPILIVEDSPAKATAIRECIAAYMPDSKITETDTIAVAGQLLDGGSWSGIVLDLAFHKTQRNADKLDRPYLAGVEILQQLRQMRLRIPVVVATQHSSFVNTKYGTFDSEEAISAMLEAAFPTNFIGLVKVDLGTIEWRSRIGELMRKHFK